MASKVVTCRLCRVVLRRSGIPEHDVDPGHLARVAGLRQEAAMRAAVEAVTGWRCAR